MQFEIEENLLEEGSFEIVSFMSGCSGNQGFPIKDSRETDQDQFQIRLASFSHQPKIKDSREKIRSWRSVPDEG